MRVGKYIRLGLIGAGTYGTVYKAKEYGTNNFFAIKQINQDDVEDGIPSSTIREIGILLEFRQQCHPNIVYLHEIIHRDGDISMVFEYVDYDLKRFQKDYTKSMNLKMNNSRNSSIGLPVNFVKSVCRQIMEAMMFCHQHKVLHRDIKPSNLLLTMSGIVKLADFGLSRTFSFPSRTYCHEVVTLWYRAPEIMLGAGNYTYGIDIWSIGCIIPELLCGHVLFPGDSEIDQLFLIFKKFGTPTESEWPGVSNFPDFKPTFPSFPKANDLHVHTGIPRDAQTLINTMLSYDPDKRGTVNYLINYKFLSDAISPIPLSRLLTINS